MTYPSGRVVNFNYATGGGCCNSRLSSTVDQTTNTTVNGGLTYNAAGETTANTLGNGVVQTYTYNNRLQVTGITASLSSGTSLMNFTYDYGTNTTNTGRVLSRTDAIQPEHSMKYSYDSIYRLSQAVSNDVSHSLGLAWTFDIWGNRLTQTPLGLATTKVGAQTLGYANNRLTTNTYDAVGNQTNDGSHTYTFNAENQITQMDGGAAVYAYDGEGRRMKKTVGSETTYYFYGVGGLLCEFTTTNTGATQAASTDRTTYRTSDKLGSAVLIMNSSGTVIENNRTLPYGEAWLPEVASTNDKKFTTYQRDSESGLDYAQRRFYSASNSRFTSPDMGPWKLKSPATLNRYDYVRLDPINRTDFTGNRDEGPDDPPPLPPFTPGGPSNPTPGGCPQPGPGPGQQYFLCPEEEVPVQAGEELLERYGRFSDAERSLMVGAISIIRNAFDGPHRRDKCAALFGGDAALTNLAKASFNGIRGVTIPKGSEVDKDFILWLQSGLVPKDGGGVRKAAGQTLEGTRVSYIHSWFLGELLEFQSRQEAAQLLAVLLLHELSHQIGRKEYEINDITNERLCIK